MHRIPSNRVKNRSLDTGKKDVKDPGNRDGLPGSHCYVGKTQHPTHGKAGSQTEDLVGIGDLSARNRQQCRQFCIADSHQHGHQAAAHEGQNGSHRARLSQPVAQDNDPSDSYHAAEPDTQVVDGADLFTQLGSGRI